MANKKKDKQKKKPASSGQSARPPTANGFLWHRIADANALEAMTPQVSTPIKNPRSGHSPQSSPRSSPSPDGSPTQLLSSVNGSSGAVVAVGDSYKGVVDMTNRINLIFDSCIRNTRFRVMVHIREGLMILRHTLGYPMRGPPSPTTDKESTAALFPKFLRANPDPLDEYLGEHAAHREIFISLIHPLDALHSNVHSLRVCDLFNILKEFNLLPSVAAEYSGFERVVKFLVGEEGDANPEEHVLVVARRRHHHRFVKMDFGVKTKKWINSEKRFTPEFQMFDEEVKDDPPPQPTVPSSAESIRPFELLTVEKFKEQRREQKIARERELRKIAEEKAAALAKQLEVSITRKKEVHKARRDESNAQKRILERDRQIKSMERESKIDNLMATTFVDVAKEQVEIEIQKRKDLEAVQTDLLGRNAALEVEVQNLEEDTDVLLEQNEVALKQAEVAKQLFGRVHENNKVLSVEIEGLKQMNAEQSEEIRDLKEKNAEQTKKIMTQDGKIAEQAEKIGELEKEIATQGGRIAELVALVNQVMQNQGTKA